MHTLTLTKKIVKRQQVERPVAQVIDWKPQAAEIPVQPLQTGITPEVKHNAREM